MAKIIIARAVLEKARLSKSELNTVARLVKKTGVVQAQVAGVEPKEVEVKPNNDQIENLLTKNSQGALWSISQVEEDTHFEVDDRVLLAAIKLTKAYGALIAKAYEVFLGIFGTTAFKRFMVVSKEFEELLSTKAKNKKAADASFGKKK